MTSKRFYRPGAVLLLAGWISAGAPFAAGASDGLSRDGAAPRSQVTLAVSGGASTLAFDGAVFHTTGDAVEELASTHVGESVAVTWSQRAANGNVTPYYAVSLDGRTIAAVRETTYRLMLRYANFDPHKALPAVEAELAAAEGTRVHVVQFITQPVQAYVNVIEQLGGTIRYFLPNHAYIVEMSPDVRDALAAQPFVRWVGPYHPAYKLDAELLAAFRAPNAAVDVQRYNIQVLDRGIELKEVVADHIDAIGGVIDVLEPDGHFLEATLSWDQLLDVMRMDETFYVDRWSPPQTFMDKVREDGGANHVESVAGYTGAGVRGEVMDTELLTSHQAFQARPPLVHRNGQATTHGTSVYGIVFGDGTGNVNGRGMIPDAQGIFAFWSPPNRHAHTAELLESPYYAVFQTNSWGQCCRTDYGSEAQQMDDIAFQYDFLLLQAQANNGNRTSSGHAWGKNIVSVGGIRHRDTLTRNDDAWSNSGSIGPAEDGRIKPDLAYWYDSILTTSRSGGYTTGFGGTSAATPETAGHFGLMFQMWNDGIFGNEVDPEGTVFENRPHLATAKAIMINTAEPYPFSGQGHDLTRVHQGFGLANVRNLFEMRDKFFIIDESDVLSNLDSTIHLVEVAGNTPALKATLVYTDLAGTTSANQHRINDLSLKVTSPSGVIYHGNVGLLDGNWSTPGGSRNTKDTVENVWVQNPEEGTWQIEVTADEINRDAHPETPEVDADYALVVSGVIAAEPEPAACCFVDGGCDDLLPDECAGEGGRYYFGKECGTFECPLTGACCVNDSECRQMLQRECDGIPGAEFLGEGVACERACICDNIKKFKGKCKGSGLLKVVLKFRHNGYDGRPVSIKVADRNPIEIEVEGKAAKMVTCCFSGATRIELIDPAGCVDPINVNCP